ncbi:hypothetical protein ACETRX_03740 [Labrys portucalensis]|uniref:PH domain-containing protein n=1 Tax=Labrys neptuniae TaxID=376174 RepID=A0ABV6Z940_9HYPH
MRLLFNVDEKQGEDMKAWVLVLALAVAGCNGAPHAYMWKPNASNDMKGRDLTACVNAIPEGSRQDAATKFVDECVRAKGYKPLFIPGCPNFTETNYVRAHPYEEPKCDAG